MKYIYYDTRKHPHVGVNHYRYNLRLMLAEAILLGRTPILPPLRLPAHHNFGHPQQQPYSHILSMRIPYKKREKATMKSGVIEYLEEHDMDWSMFSDSDTAIANENELVDPAINATHPLIIRRMSSAASFNPLLKQQETADSSIAFRMEPAQRLIDIFNSLKSKLGSFASDDFYKDLPYQNSLNLNSPSLESWGHACAHIRGTDRIKEDFIFLAGITPALVSKNIQRCLSKRDIPLYIMSDIRDRKFFKRLDQRYRTLYAYDFDELRRFYPNGDDAGDNITLYAMETMIMEKASIKISSHPRNQTNFFWHP